jgi:hypothetical protein
LASPIKVEQPLTLPPMKVEPLNIPTTAAGSSSKRNVSAKTPTRIPLPAIMQQNSSTSTISTTSTSTSSASKQRILLKKSLHESTSSDDDRTKPLSNSSSSRIKQQLRKPKSSSAVSLATSTTPRLQSSKSAKSTEEPVSARTAKTSIMGGGSASTRTTITGGGGLSTSQSTTAKATPTVSSSKQRKLSTLQERLQGLVDESKSWTTHMEREKSTSTSLKVEGQTSEIVLRGRGTTTSTSLIDPSQPSTSTTAQKVMMRVAMSPEAAQKLYQFNLTNFENQEMLKYENIYFVGHHAKKRPASPSNPQFNFGYDDERGDYLLQMRDHLHYRYEVLEIMGKGSFGQVLKCFDHKNGQTVAIKVIRNKKRFHAQALVEVKILEQLINWDPEDKYNNVRMMGHFMFRNHLCIVFECLSINLYEFIKSNGFQGFSMGLIRR